MQILLLHGKQKVFAECDWLRPSFVPSSSLTERALGQTNSCQHDQREVCCRRVHAYIYIYIYYIYGVYILRYIHSRQTSTCAKCTDPS